MRIELEASRWVKNTLLKSAKTFHNRQAHYENLYFFVLFGSLPPCRLHDANTRTPFANGRHCLPPPVAFGFWLLESSGISTKRAYSL